MYLFHRGLFVLLTAALYLLVGNWLPLHYPLHPIPARLAGLFFLIAAMLIVKEILGTLIVAFFILGLLFTSIALFLGNPKYRLR